MPAMSGIQIGALAGDFSTLDSGFRRNDDVVTRLIFLTKHHSLYVSSLTMQVSEACRKS